jgi:hypothetical protein
MARKLSNDELLSIIEAHEARSLGDDDGELTSDRTEALDRYFGRPYGDEVDGRSAVVSQDLREAVDWIMPSLIRVFLASDDFLRFDPVGPEDEAQAEQESDYTNHVIVKKNHGFTLLYDWFWDALVLKNGYVKAWWDESEEVTHETYAHKTVDELALLFQELESGGDKIEVVGQSSESLDGIEYFEVKIRRTKKYGCVKIVPIPPEEIRVSRRTRGSLQESPFVQHETTKTRSELIEIGMKESFVEGLPAWDDQDSDEEHLARDQVAEENFDGSAATADRSMDEIEYKENYLRVDYDGDGIAELRKIVVVGGEIPSGERWNEEIDNIPVYYLTPKRIPHRHIGLSIEDELADVARIKTTLWRQLLDNTYLLNNVEWLVNQRVNLSDFLTSRPGGVKRVNGESPIGDAATPVMKTPIIQHVLPVLDYMDTVKENRAGVGRNTMGLDADTLKKTTEGAARMALSQANQKIEMVARLFGETGIKDLALAVHALLVKHQDKKAVEKLRGKWVDVNPTEWRERTNLTVNVGLGTGSQEEVRSNLLLMAQLQQQAAQAGIVSPRNAYNLAEKLSDQLGFKQQGMFFTDPDSEDGHKLAQSQQGGPNPLVQAEQVKAEYKSQIDQMKEQMKGWAENQRLQFEAYKFEKEHGLKVAVEEIKALIAGLKAVDLGQPGLGTETKTATP